GYEEVITPTIEYFDTLAVGMGERLQEKSIRFLDPSGSLYVMRPDHTTPIARLAATRMAKTKHPLKLFYTGSIFRKQKKDTGDLEIFQAGQELIGDPSPKADAEMIVSCINALLSLGHKNICIDIGHVDFIKSVSPSKRQALLEGDYIKFGQLPDRGGPKTIKGHKDLEAILKILKKENVDQYVSFNKGLVKGIYYYTGIIFEAYVEGNRNVVASGGRYDQLLAKFGHRTPAVGYALNLSHLHDRTKRT
ncbi:MAG: ATP phosphoribosyltransferase regulatory subunit, partial [Candidatus Marinamargulisbacteria bacterium]